MFCSKLSAANKSVLRPNLSTFLILVRSPAGMASRALALPAHWSAQRVASSYAGSTGPNC